MSFLPIVDRELRATARKTALYRVRIAFALVTSLLAAILLVLGSFASVKQMGTVVFPILTKLAFVYCLIAGARNSADCLSEEKREGTLGLLFLTDLRGYDVVLGKFVATSARTFHGLLALFPILALGLVLGGVTAGEFWRTTAVLTNMLFVSLAAGCLISSFSREAHRALASTLVVLALLTALAFVPGLTPMGKVTTSPVAWLAYGSPATAAMLTPDLAYQANPRHYWAALVWSHGLGWLFLAGASVLLPWVFQERSLPKFPLGTGSGRELPRGTAEALVHRDSRRRLLDINPILWLAARHHQERWVLWGGIVLVVVGGTIAYWFQPVLGGARLAIVTTLAAGLCLVLKLWVAWAASSTFAEARRTGAMELLLATPLRSEEIVRGNWLALRRFFLWPVVIALTLRALPVIGEMLVHPPSLNVLFFLPMPAILLFGLATFVTDLFAIGWVGMWMGASERKPLQAFVKTVLFVVIIPAFIFCLPNLLFDVFWISWARRRLETNFRTAAVDRFSPAQGFLQRTRPSSSAGRTPPVIVSSSTPRIVAK